MKIKIKIIMKIKRKMKIKSGCRAFSVNKVSYVSGQWIIEFLHQILRKIEGRSEVKKRKERRGEVRRKGRYVRK